MMICVFRLLCLLAALLTGLFVGLPLAAQDNGTIELRLPSEVSCRESVIRLGELVDIQNAEFTRWESLAAIEMFPAPAEPTRVHYRDLSERLALRGVDVQNIRFTGSESVLIRPADEFVERTHGQPVVQFAVHQTELRETTAGRGTQEVSRLILDHLHRRATADAQWQIDVQMRPEDERIASLMSGPFQIAGLAPPWAGTHNVTVRGSYEGQVVDFEARVSVTSDTQVVMLARPVQRGEVIQASHLRLVPLTERTTARDLVYHVQDVIGTAAKRNLGGGQLVQANWFERPRVVKRGDRVYVVVQRGGVKVTTQGVAKQDGAVDDIIQVESENPKRSYHVVVVGPGTTTLSSTGTEFSGVRR